MSKEIRFPVLRNTERVVMNTHLVVDDDKNKMEIALEKWGCMYSCIHPSGAKSSNIGDGHSEEDIDKYIFNAITGWGFKYGSWSERHKCVGIDDAPLVK